MARKLPDISSRREISLDPELSILIIGLFCAASDGYGISIKEEDCVRKALGKISQFANYSNQEFKDLTTKVINLLDEGDGTESLIHTAVSSLPNKDYREAAYITAILTVSVDGEIYEEEEDFIYDLQEALSISDERAEELKAKFLS